VVSQGKICTLGVGNSVPALMPRAEGALAEAVHEQYLGVAYRSDTSMSRWSVEDDALYRWA